MKAANLPHSPHFATGDSSSKRVQPLPRKTHWIIHEGLYASLRLLLFDILLPVHVIVTSFPRISATCL